MLQAALSALVHACLQSSSNHIVCWQKLTWTSEVNFDHAHNHNAERSCLIAGVEDVADHSDRHDAKRRLEPCMDYIHRPQLHMLHTAAGWHKLKSEVA